MSGALWHWGNSCHKVPSVLLDASASFEKMDCNSFRAHKCSSFSLRSVSCISLALEDVTNVTISSSPITVCSACATSLETVYGTSAHWLLAISVARAHKTITILVEKAFSDSWFSETYDLNLTKDPLRELLELATTNLLFQLNGTLYEQVKGVAMGSPLRPLLAKLANTLSLSLHIFTFYSCL